jgi:hypothetical protein
MQVTVWQRSVLVELVTGGKILHLGNQIYRLEMVGLSMRRRMRCRNVLEMQAKGLIGLDLAITKQGIASVSRKRTWSRRATV